MISTEQLIGALAVALGSSFFITTTQLAVNVMTPPPIEGIGIAPAKVSPNDVVPVEWTIIKRTSCPGENGRVWNGADGFDLHEPIGSTKLPASTGPKVYTIDTRIPSYAPSGALSLSIDGWYQCAGQDKVFWTIGPVEMTVEREAE